MVKTISVFHVSILVFPHRCKRVLFSLSTIHYLPHSKSIVLLVVLDKKHDRLAQHLSLQMSRALQLITMESRRISRCFRAIRLSFVFETSGKQFAQRCSASLFFSLSFFFFSHLKTRECASSNYCTGRCRLTKPRGENSTCFRNVSITRECLHEHEIFIIFHLDLGQVLRVSTFCKVIDVHDVLITYVYVYLNECFFF